MNKIKNIKEIAANIGISGENFIPYGRYIGKINYINEKVRLDKLSVGKLVVVTSITPTKAGEGKTCTAIGLTQALGKIGKNVSLCLREPSLGPIFGIKGGATGTDKAKVIPSEEINLHFTGDMHAVTSAHNLLASIVDNHVVKDNSLNINPKRIVWNRALDINDRELRYVILGLKKKSKALKRSTGFIITAASEIMAILSLSKNIKDLRSRLEKIIVAYNYDGQIVRCKELNVVGALLVLLKNALNPNLVQTLEGQPVFIHAGPFANIAHGNNSIIATKTALALSDIVVTESGFGSDLGMEKLFDIVLPRFKIKPSAVVLVASTRALKMHGGVNDDNLEKEDLDSLNKGLVNLEQHINIIKTFGVIPVVAVNRFPSDTVKELNLIKDYCQKRNIPVAISEVVSKGSEGGIDLAQKVIESLDSEFKFTPIYNSTTPLKNKIEDIATKLYKADGVQYSDKAQKDIEFLKKNNLNKLPVNIAKTQLSFTNNPKLKGAPHGWRLKVTEIKPAAGAGFLTVLTGKIRLMPGLPAKPAAEDISLSDSGEIKGLI